MRRPLIFGVEPYLVRAMVVGNTRALENTVITCLRSIPDIEVVGTAIDGREGIKLAKDVLPDLVIAEFNMPDMSGPALTRSLKTDGIPPPAVILVSSTDNSNYAQLAYQAGADGYVARSTFGKFMPLVKRLKERRA